MKKHEVCCHNERCKYQHSEQCYSEAVWIGPLGECFSFQEADVVLLGGDQNDMQSDCHC